MTRTGEVTLTGNLTREVELRYTTSGTALAKFGLAVNYGRKVNGEWEDDPSFFNVTAWRDLAENIADSVDKGSRVIVTGRPRQRNWENEDGEKRSTVEIEADDVAVSLRWHIVTGTEKSSRGNGTNNSNQPPTSAYDEAEEPF